MTAPMRRDRAELGAGRGCGSPVGPGPSAPLAWPAARDFGNGRSPATISCMTIPIEKSLTDTGAIVGTGAAGKDQVKWMIARQFGLDPSELAEDAADALALCLAHAQRAVAHALGR